MTRLTAYATPVALVCLVASLGWLMAWGLRDAGKPAELIHDEEQARQYAAAAIARQSQHSYDP